MQLDHRYLAPARPRRRQPVSRWSTIGVRTPRRRLSSQAKLDPTGSGFLLTAAGFDGLPSQLLWGAFSTHIRSKRTGVALGVAMVSAGALMIAVWPIFSLALAALTAFGPINQHIGQPHLRLYPLCCCRRIVDARGHRCLPDCARC